MYSNPKKKDNSHESRKKQSACLCLIMLYSFQAILYFIAQGTGKRDSFSSIIVLILPIICIIGYIFFFLWKKTKDKPPPQEIPYKPKSI
ncbi:MAG: hypothetical protein ACFE9I_17895 [Candidatus Hermodarchaeota archaeon]